MKYKKIEISEYNENLKSLQFENYKILFFSYFLFNDAKTIFKTHINLPGIYIIFKKTDNGEREFYVGQSSAGFFERIKDPNHEWNKKDDKNDFMVYITCTNIDKAWNKSELDFFESKFISFFSSISTTLKKINKTIGNYNKNISENSEALYLYSNTFEELSEKLLFVLPKDLFISTVKKNKSENQNDFKLNELSKTSIELYLKKDAINIKAIWNKNNNKILLYKGTKFDKNIINSDKPHMQVVKNKLNKLRTDNFVNERFELVEDFWFSSTTIAAELILGYVVSGPSVWIEGNSKLNLKVFGYRKK